MVLTANSDGRFMDELQAHAEFAVWAVATLTTVIHINKTTGRKVEGVIESMECIHEKMKKGYFGIRMQPTHKNSKPIVISVLPGDKLYAK